MRFCLVIIKNVGHIEYFTAFIFCPVAGQGLFEILQTFTGLLVKSASANKVESGENAILEVAK